MNIYIFKVLRNKMNIYATRDYPDEQRTFTLYVTILNVAQKKKGVHHMSQLLCSRFIISEIRVNCFECA